MRLLNLALHFHKRRNILGHLWVCLDFEERDSPSDCSSFNSDTLSPVIEFSVSTRMSITLHIHVCVLNVWKHVIFQSPNGRKIEYLIDLTLPAALWPRVDSASKRNGLQAYLLGLKADGAYS